MENGSKDEDCLMHLNMGYKNWDRSKYAEGVSNYLATYVPESHEIDQHLVGMLSMAMETYVECQIAIERDGIVITDSKDNPIRQSPYVKVRNAELVLIRKIMRELKMLPINRLRK